VRSVYPVVSDGRGQLIAIAQTDGDLEGTDLDNPEYQAGFWNSSGLTAHAQSFDPRRQSSPTPFAPISTFRNRQYDPSTGRWLQEDPIGLSGGANLYQYNGNDPNSFSDLFGLCPPCDNNGSTIDRAWVVSHATANARAQISIFSAAQGLASLAGAGVRALVAAFTESGAPQTAAAVAKGVAAETGGLVEPLAKSEGFKVTVSGGSRTSLLESRNLASTECQLTERRRSRPVGSCRVIEPQLIMPAPLSPTFSAWSRWQLTLLRTIRGTMSVSRQAVYDLLEAGILSDPKFDFAGRHVECSVTVKSGPKEYHHAVEFLGVGYLKWQDRDRLPWDYVELSDVVIEFVGGDVQIALHFWSVPALTIKCASMVVDGQTVVSS
jgi:hypothetical protein